MKKNKVIFVAGHRGMVGSAICRELSKQTKNTVLTASRSSLDLTNQQAVQDFFKNNTINEVYLAAAKVGGIYANNTYPADFIYENLMIQSNIIYASHQNNIQKLLFLGSSCVYPKLANQPIQESELLVGYLEPTNEPYAIAKIAGIKLCSSYNRQFGRDYRSVMPTNLYGENDNFHPEHSHVIPALLRRFHEAKLNQDKTVTVWGTGMPMREFLHVDDLAKASLFVMNLSADIYHHSTSQSISHLNIGTGQDCTISELVHTIIRVVDYQGTVDFDTSKPEGTKRKVLNISKLKELGWEAETSLEEGLTKTYQWFLQNQGKYRSI